MIKVEQNLGVAGEFRVVVRRADGSIKLDTGMQPNLVLDNGLRFYLGVPMINNSGVQQTEHKGDFMACCVVGTGNSQPQQSDVSLQSIVAKNVSYASPTYGQEQPTSELHDGFVKVWRSVKYIFDNINNQNITEVGLATWYGNDYIGGKAYNNSYSLVTRALIKDSSGKPITVTVLEGEVLEIIYQINMYVDIRRKTGSFALTTTKGGKDTTETFDYFLQPYEVENRSGVLDSVIWFNASYMGITSWGVKETDDELTADYDLNDAVYQSITHLNTTGLSDKVEGNTSTHDNGSKYSGDYMTYSTIERSLETGRRTAKVVNGIYTHIHDNGIRAFNFWWGDTYNALVKGLVVLKNRANGQGIKKTNRQLWEFTHSYTISRWEG